MIETSVSRAKFKEPSKMGERYRSDLSKGTEVRR